MAQRFAQDTANQATQTRRFAELVEETSANNKRLLSVTDAIMASAKGQMATAFENHAREIHQVCQQNNAMLDTITGNLHQGISMVEAQEQQGASYFRSIQ